MFPKREARFLSRPGFERSSIMEPLPVPDEPPETVEYDVRSNDEEQVRRTAPIQRYGPLGGIGGLAGGSAVLLLSGQGVASPVGVAGLGLLATGVLALYFGLQSRRLPIDVARVAPGGFSLSGAGRERLSVRWAARRGPVFLFDYRGTPSPMNRLPCVVGTGLSGAWGISGDALEAIRSSARAGGAEVATRDLRSRGGGINTTIR